MGVREMRLVLTVDDLEAAAVFFRDTLGLAQLDEFHQDGGRGLLLDAGRATLELFDEKQAAAIDRIEVGRRVTGAVRIAFQVDDSESAAHDLAGAGGEIVGGPVVAPWGDRNVRLVGPQGVQLTLFS